MLLISQSDLEIFSFHSSTCVTCVQVYEVTIFEAEDDDSFDEDTEITEAVSVRTRL